MGELQTKSLDDAVRSYANWWREAGLDCVTQDEPFRWREAPQAPFWRQATPPAPAAPSALAPPAAEPRAPDETPRPASSTDMPGTLPEFLAWLAHNDAQPEAQWDGALVLPPALEEPKLVVVIEMPASGASDSASLLDDSQRRFVQAMLGSLGPLAQQAPLVSLAMRRPPGGLLEEAVLTELGERMAHYLGLARPAAVLTLGDRTGRAVLGKEWRPNTGATQKVDGSGGSMDIVSLAGPDLLMSRPAAKAKSWQSLRLLHEVLNK